MFRRFALTLAGLAFIGSLWATAPAQTTSAPATRPNAGPANIPAIRLDRKDPSQPSKPWLARLDANIALAKKGNLDLIFDGDSGTDHFHETGLAVWNREFAPWKAENFAIAGDRTQHLLYRLQHGQLDGIAPRAFVILIGTNNASANSPEEIAAGIKAILDTLHEKQPQAKILLLAILPRDKPGDRLRDITQAANKLLAKFDDGQHIKYFDLAPFLLNPDGTFLDGVMQKDLTHPSEKGYQVWADAIKPILTEWLGPLPPAPTPVK